jgi:two-component system, chemotaxis family, CheB/CheR fusion protein
VPGSSFAELKAALLKNHNWVGELRQKTKSGQELLVESRIELKEFDGRRLVLESTRDVTARDATEKRLRVLLGELTHRVRNTLAVIQAIARHTVRNSESMNDFIERFEGRLAALASAHTLLVGSEWKGADLAELARQQLAPYITDNPSRLRLEGEPISLSADLATPVGLVLHELATNAAKYGSLSVSAGAVSVSWTNGMRNNHRMLKLIWKETGGPAAGKPTTAGIGDTLVNNVIPGAHVEREFASAGLVCTIELPVTESVEDGVFGAAR